MSDPVTLAEAIDFCNSALRNVDEIRLHPADIADIADALTHFRDKAVQAAILKLETKRGGRREGK